MTKNDFGVNGMNFFILFFFSLREDISLSSFPSWTFAYFIGPQRLSMNFNELTLLEKGGRKKYIFRGWDMKVQQDC